MRQDGIDRQAAFGPGLSRHRLGGAGRDLGRVWLLGLVLIAAFAGPATTAEPAPCGGDVPCAVAGGSYRIELPAGVPPAELRGVYLFFHGYMNSAEGQMRDRALVTAAAARGLAFAAVDGLDGTWSHPGAPASARDEFAVTAAVLDDLDARFGFGRDRVVVGGFSQGASMAWYALCRLGDRIAAGVTFSGVFWNPLPAPGDCTAALPPLVHIHGRADGTFPLAGRPIGSRWHQGDTRASIAILEARAGCTATTSRALADVADCTVATGCRRGDIALCLHPGGHTVLPDLFGPALDLLGVPPAR
ncbi:alpha/beta hydrolase family esterase [Methylobrevis albus]|uniref:Poly(3-hydroxybutyrate) depolymerase n=1 Tax=Methylobrevis albus TaxID=2793297 RepID=A0A931MXP4_9HYPH|nr:poly(3-hydroxybutyrate) depolymerase [Methylobrevis albus]MBH0237190.1 poly(3-hydroxybutyrate) depolymerase [Methylobrevis albus]